MTNEPVRCEWAGGDEAYQRYHDLEWGVPVTDDAKLFECITLEGAQAGLSWRTILNKREGYRSAFLNFDPQRVAQMDEGAVDRLLLDSGIVRHRGKIQSTINNARRILEIQAEVGSFAQWVWGFVDGRPRQNSWQRIGDVPGETMESKALSKALKRCGFRFVGPTTAYAFMQAAGMVNDHQVTCFRHSEIRELPFVGV